jgi:hypothetical protein
MFLALPDHPRQLQRMTIGQLQVCKLLNVEKILNLCICYIDTAYMAWCQSG